MPEDRRAAPARRRAVPALLFVPPVPAADPMRDDRGEPPLPEGFEDHLRPPGHVGEGGKP